MPDQPAPATNATDPPRRPRGTPALYPEAYTWLVFVSAMDVMFTWVILFLGGRELNALAAALIRWGGLAAMAAFKFGLVAFVIVLCEIVGRRSPRAGRGLAYCGVVISAAPVAVSVALLVRHFHFPPGAG